MPSDRVFISVSPFGEHDPTPLKRLEQEGIQYRTNPYGRTLTEAEMAQLIGGAEGLIAGIEPLTRAVLEHGPCLRVISRVGTGLDNVDLAAARRLGIAVCSTPDAPTEAVAEMALAGMLALLRHIPQMDAELHVGLWNPRVGRLLKGKNVGIIGLGRIGKRLAVLLQPWEVNILAHDIAPERAWALAHQVHLVGLRELLSSADIVSLHASRQPGSLPLLGTGEIALLKPGAYLVNTARGALVAEGPLVEALRSGAVAGAYLDTFSEEPYAGPLAQLPNVLLTPHVGSFALEARIRMETEATENLIERLENRRHQP